MPGPWRLLFCIKLLRLKEVVWLLATLVQAERAARQRIFELKIILDSMAHLSRGGRYISAALANRHPGKFRYRD